MLNDIWGTLPDPHSLVRISVRLLAAMLVGTLIGLQRELTHKPAGLRTHMLVALGTALLVISAEEAALGNDGISRVIQGLITGIGFLGGGAILKLTAEHEIHGLTTAAGVWMTAAASAAAGLGQIGPALVGLGLALLVLVSVRRVERLLGHHGDAENRHERQPPPRPEED
jgi:putative Mg2+ transporter-C (MgtC) family protein